MDKFMITTTDNGHAVYVNLIDSLAGRYLNRRPYVISLIEEVLSSLKLKGERMVVEQDMGRDIGATDIVVTSEKDSVYYARPLKTEVFSRFAKNRHPQLSQMLTIVIQQDTDGKYEVQDTWIGPSSPAFPGDEHATTESETYWQSHALVPDAQAIQPKTITLQWPY